MDNLKFMWRGGNVARYHTEYLIKPDLVGHHSYNVACIIMHLRPNADARLLRAALKHDMAENITGDMPAPAKRAMPGYGDVSFRDAYALIEDDFMRAAGVPIEDLDEEEAWLLKLADAMDGMRYCVQERAMGNKLIAPCYVNFKTYVKDLLKTGEDKTFAALEDYELYGYLKKEWKNVDK